MSTATGNLTGSITDIATLTDMYVQLENFFLSELEYGEAGTFKCSFPEHTAYELTITCGYGLEEKDITAISKTKMCTYVGKMPHCNEKEVDVFTESWTAELPSAFFRTELKLPKDINQVTLEEQQSFKKYQIERKIQSIFTEVVYVIKKRSESKSSETKPEAAAPKEETTDVSEKTPLVKNKKNSGSRFFQFTKKNKDYKG